MKTITIDQNAWDVLIWAKKKATDAGIEKPSHSDAIRWMQKTIESKR